MSRLHDYLRRIEYGGPLSADYPTLRALQRAHLLAVPFENLDVQLGLEPPHDIDGIFGKIVTGRRGGWCYEMNGLFGWALRELGFTVDFVGAAVSRDKKGDDALMNHLALIVHLERPYLTDVGFGDGPLLPLPLTVGSVNDGRFDYAITRNDGWWRLHNRDGSTYDFTEEPHALEHFAAKAHAQATDPTSHFVANLHCARLTDDGVVTLTNASLREQRRREMREETAQNAGALSTILAERFGIHRPNVDALWDRASVAHRKMIQKKIRGF